MLGGFFLRCSLAYNAKMRWRLGTTSYIYHGDLAHNLRCLAGQVDDVELILFDGAWGSNIPSRAETATLRSILEDAGMSVTVHLPADVGGAVDTARRSNALMLNLRTIDAVASLNPWAWIFHVESEGAGTLQWSDSAHSAIARLVGAVDNAAELALENLESYNPALLERFFVEHGIARTLDIGHLWKQAADAEQVKTIVNEWLPCTRVIHLHGVESVDGMTRDHCSLAQLSPGRLAELTTLLPLLAEWQGVLTLEVFEEDYFSSRIVLERMQEAFRDVA